MELNFTPEPITERHVQALWYDNELRPNRLYSRRGAEIIIVDPGRWNLGPGPDFKDATLEIVGGTILKGDVEVHLHPFDWDVHRHGEDPLYKNVIAHISWYGGPEPTTLPMTAVSIWLGRTFSQDIGFSPEMIDLSAYPFAKVPLSYRPCYLQAQKDRDGLLEVIRQAGERRIKIKTSRMRRLKFRRRGEERQLFYEEVMGALGYRYNSQGFRQVASTVPVASLTSEPEVAEDALVSASQFYDWRLKGCRPCNYPIRRLRAAAKLITETEIMHYCEQADFSAAGCRMMVKEISGAHYVGKGRAAAIVTNVIVPFMEGRPDWLPPEDINEVMRLTAIRIFGRDHNPAIYKGNNILLQGLIQIHRDWCLQWHPSCSGCPMDVSVGERNSSLPPLLFSGNMI